MIDLRSDTVTKPSEEMRAVIAAAEVGDDVFGDDPTVNRLQDMVAEMFGCEAALFVPSGSMGNQVSLYTHSTHGDEIICEEGCHIFNYEVAAAAAISGLLFHVVPGRHGVFTAEQIKPFVRQQNLHSPGTRLIAIENTHNRAGGTIFPLEEIIRISELAREHGVKMHLDGARIWNAHVATGIPFAEYARYFDSISVCLSKGLGAPIGSIIIADADFIARAERTRKMFGGGMRQVGILAAAGIYALENNIKRLVRDHENARHLAESLAEIDGIEIDLETVQTNIVIFDVAPSGREVSEILEQLAQREVLAVPFGPTRIRCVTHLDVSAAQISDAVRVFREVFGS